MLGFQIIKKYLNIKSITFFKTPLLNQISDLELSVLYGDPLYEFLQPPFSCCDGKKFKFMTSISLFILSFSFLESTEASTECNVILILSIHIKFAE
jgi:hypothetical protein